MRIIAFTLAAVALLVMIPVGAPGQVAARWSSDAPDTAVVHVSGGAIDSALRSLAATTSAADNARDLPTGDLARYGFVVLSRRVTGPAELHERWSDVVVVRSGAAMLTTGRTLAGQRAQGQGEFSGSAISHGRDQAVGPGDVLVIPAGLAHQWRPTGHVAFSYLVLKVHPGRASSSVASAP